MLSNTIRKAFDRERQLSDKSEYTEKIKIHVLRTGEVRVSPYLPFGGDDCSLLKASGITTPKSKWIWLPVFSFLIEHPRGLVLFDTGWHREMSPNGVYDKGALCFGWIDSTLKELPDGQLAQRLSPHRKGSHWTGLNLQRYCDLEHRGLMTDSGRKALKET